MKVLGFESSCDETGVALVESVEVLSLELENVRRRTLANEIDPSERLQLHQWLRDNQAALARIIQKHDGNL